MSKIVDGVKNCYAEMASGLNERRKMFETSVAGAEKRAAKIDPVLAAPGAAWGVATAAVPTVVGSLSKVLDTFLMHDSDGKVCAE